jgi:prepilin-type N-terminal cleavage/methylation domain-containing protein
MNLNGYPSTGNEQQVIVNNYFTNLMIHATRKGFTATELMVAMTIVSLLAAVATADILSGLPKRRLTQAARQIVSDLTAARMTAAAENRLCRLTADPGAGTYLLEALDTDPLDGSATWRTTGLPRKLTDPESPFFQKGVTLAGISRTITLKPDGRVVSGSLFLENDQGDSLKVTISDAGRIKVE